jgi:hypothetical protein
MSVAMFVFFAIVAGGCNEPCVEVEEPGGSLVCVDVPDACTGFGPACDGECGEALDGLCSAGLERQDCLVRSNPLGTTIAIACTEPEAATTP